VIDLFFVFIVWHNKLSGVGLFSVPASAEFLPIAISILVCDVVSFYY